MEGEFQKYYKNFISQCINCVKDVTIRLNCVMVSSGKKTTFEVCQFNHSQFKMKVKKMKMILKTSTATRRPLSGGMLILSALNNLFINIKTCGAE